MSQLGRLHDVFRRLTGVPAVGTTVEIRRQGATVRSNQSGTSPLTVDVADNGAIQAGDTVVIGTGTTSYTVDSIAFTAGVAKVTISGFGGTLVLNQGDRLSPTNSLPSLKADSQGINAFSNPLVTDDNGEFSAWADISPYDIKTSGGGFATRLFQDVWPAGVVIVRVNCSPDPAGDAWIFDAKHLPSTGKIIRFQVDGVDKFFVNADGTISGTVAVSVPDPLSLVNGLTVGGLTTLNGGAGIIGGLTVDNFTGTGTFTVAAGAIATAALANNAVSATPVTIRGGSSNVDLTPPGTQFVRTSTSYTPAGTTSKLLISYNAVYRPEGNATNIRSGLVELFIDGVLQFPYSFGPTQLAGNFAFAVPVTFTWIATGLTNAAHTIEVKDSSIQQAGAAGQVFYLGASVQAAMHIQELKK